MNRKLLSGIGLVAVFGVAALIAFSLGIRLSTEPSLATSEDSASVSDTSDIPAQTEPKVLESSALEIEPANEVVQTDFAFEPGVESISSNVEQARGPQDGVKVHGSWTIEVTELDGRLVSRTEFDNALTSLGKQSLSKFLAHDAVPGKWRLWLSGQSVGSSPCTNNSGDIVSCQLWEVPATDPTVADNPHVGPLTVEAPTSGPNTDKLVISGSVPVQRSTNIDIVQTDVLQCNTSSTPADFETCQGPFTQFTWKLLDTPVAVLENQVVNVTVVISFS